jgi:type VI protein secretion system component Hcp
MKGLKTLAVLALAVCALPVFGALNAYLKIDGFDSGLTYPGHEGWINLTSWSWGVSNQRPGATVPAAACATNDAKFGVHVATVSEGNLMPSPVVLKLQDLVMTHKQLPAVTVEINGQRHVLQNVTFSSFQGLGQGNHAGALNFTRCATHSGAVVAAMVNPNVHPVATTKILVGLTPRPEAFDFSSFQFQGSNGAIILQRNAVQGNFLQQAFQSKQKFPSLTVERKAGKGSPEYFTVKMSDVLVSSYQVMGDGSVKIRLSFAKVDGSTRGFQEEN